MKKIIKSVLLLTLLTLLISCASCKENAQNAEIVLKGNATTGYCWSAIPDNSGIYEIIKEEYVPDSSKPGATGVGGQYHAVLSGIKQGEGFVKFVYKRSWEDSPIEEKIFKVSVDEKLNITIEKNQGV